MEDTNIFGDVPSGDLLNLPRADCHFSVMQFYNLDDDKEEELKKYIRINLRKGEALRERLGMSSKQDENYDMLTNQSKIEQKFCCACFIQDIIVGCASIHKGHLTRWGTIIDEPDVKSRFHTESDDNDNNLYCLLYCSDAPSLYKGEIAF